MSSCYPDIRQKNLRSCIGQMEQTDPKNIICSNGASELFFAIVRAICPSNALVIAPCFFGYYYALESLFCKVEEYILSPDREFEVNPDVLDYITDDTDVFFLAAPNNPTGRLIDEGLLADIYKKCQEKNCILVTDACFHPLSNSGRLYGDIIVKAFTKVMSMPGVRLGYGIINDEVLRCKVSRQLPEWNVSIFAQEMGIAAAKYMAGSGFLKKSVEIIERERQFLTDQLSDIGIRVFKSDTSFLLLYTKKDLYSGLLKKGILIRDAANFSGLKRGYYRIAIRSRKDNIRLIEEIRKL